MSLALLESRKRVEFWKKSTMHICSKIVFRGIKGKEKRGNWQEKEKVDIKAGHM